MYRIVVACVLMLGSLFSAVAQDTTWVQTLSFDDITKRRGEYVFPKQDDYRKILMYYTLKCDRATTQDQYACGEWDYLTYNFIYDHNATYDSTYKSGVNFTLNGATPDEYSYLKTPVYDYVRHGYDYMTPVDTIFYDEYELSLGSVQSSSFLPTQGKSNVAQFLWRASELKSAGVEPGPISGIRFKVLQAGGELGVLSIRMSGIMEDTMTWGNRHSSFENCYSRPTRLDTGWANITFVRPFQWDGIQNVVVQIAVENPSGDTPYILEGHNTIFKSGFYKSGRDGFLEFNSGGDYANLGSEVQVDGGDKRTVELWAYTRSFNNAGLFQAGNTGSRLNDWTLRTTRNDDQWRIQLWGDDGDATLNGSKNSWHHYAMVYTGSLTIFYYDGQFVRQKLVDLNTPDRDLWLGRWGGNYFDGYINDVRVWEGAVPADVLNEWKNKELDSTHPQFKKLRAYYSFDHDTSLAVTDDYGNKSYTGTLQGNAWWKQMNAFDGYKPAHQLSDRPNVIFEQAEYAGKYDTLYVKERVMRRPGSLVLYNNEANNTIVADDAKKHPSQPTDTLVVWEGNVYSYTYDEKGGKLDSTMVSATNTIKMELKEWYSPTVRYEIGRYITPYGINLTLGPKGFTWIYDVTDYAALLHDTVDLSAGNQQELIDLKFAFIEGTPTHEVKKINQVWSHGTYSYGALDDDTRLSATKVDVENGAETFVMRTRLTGHGHNSDDGEFPHCCEWKDNEHELMVDGKSVHKWHIWREDCDLNPVFPQGGNWVGAREGWCPADVVTDHDINITPHVTSNQIELDYDLTDVPADNQGMRGGNYRMTMQLFQYGEASFKTDAEILMVKRPNDWEYYKRLNPACEAPIIVVKNSGSDDITSMAIEYGVSGGTKETFEWTGTLKFLETIEVELPVDASSFWVGDADQIFTATVTKVNNGTDDNDDNSSYSTHFELPEILPREKFFIQLKTNNVPEENAYEIRDAAGNLIARKDNFSANTIYRDTFDLKNGCYTFTFFDEGYGLDYWAYPAQGSGTLHVRGIDGDVLKSFDPDFGEAIYWPFAVGTISTVNEIITHEKVAVYPNPSTGSFMIELNHINSKYSVEIYSATGQLVHADYGNGDGINLHEVNLEAKPGMYLVKVHTANSVFTQQILVQ